MSRLSRLIFVILVSGCVLITAMILLSGKTGWIKLMNTGDDNNLSPELEAELIQYLKDNPDPVYPDPMLPPWVQYPHIRRGSIGWRMGPGEDYRDAFWDWYLELSEERRKQYIADNPEPEEWAGYYDLIIERTKMSGG